jgi:hypothetical protein
MLLELCLLFALDGANAKAPAGKAAVVKPTVPEKSHGVAFVAAESAWKEWAAKHDYVITSSKDERVLVLLPKERAKQEHCLDLLERSLKRFDEILPAPPPVKPEPPPSDGDNPPTDETPAPAPQPDPMTADKPWVWGGATNPLDSDTIVFGLFRKPDDYADALSKVSAAFPFLAPWAEKAKADPGCLLLQPLFGGCVDSVPGMEEWNPDNELVHRVAALAMFRRFGHQPFWVGLGVGWNVEWDVLKSIYAFPYRNSFVSVKEHGGWEADMKRKFTARGKKQPLTIDELASLKRGSFDADGAARSWGTIRFLVSNYPKETPKLLQEFQLLREKLGRKEDPGGSAEWTSWTIAAEFELGASDQKSLLDKFISVDALAQASAFFRDGKDWKKSWPKKS